MAAPDAEHLVESSSDRSIYAVRPRNDASAAAIDPQVSLIVPLRVNPAATRLRKHADYQRAYKASRKQSSSSMTFFYAPQPELEDDNPRVGITAGRVLGNAVERNRIKRRMRAAIRANQLLLPAGIDVILHPRRSVLETNYAELQREVGRIFTKVAASQGVGCKAAENKGVGIRTAGEKSNAVSGRRR